MATSLFSHAPEPSDSGRPATPIIFEVSVPHAREQAFEGFTELIHLWWPIADYGVFGEGSHLEFEERVLAETSDRDEVEIWADILEWQPGALIRLSWHRGAGPAVASRLEVAFEADGPESSIVRLVHSGWEHVPAGEAAREEYAGEWPEILAKYARFMGGLRSSVRILPPGS
ncbi:hypothetical protein [Arthrobacter mangrovi]|uniref:ATPase n=1 Tax=Arthrobacter mangrovi TaxID=2966350 RepID=A0ABQ5N008_9MICC|nr:hypothetical protein [Arthrobacter mangrovi]GLB69543.1 hypothetical protein AHIS1636_39890 [Arthrobacter mangrovi]